MFASQVWNSLPVLFPLQLDLVSNFILGTSQARKLLILPPAGIEATNLYPWVIWSLWVSRNKLIFDRKVVTAPETAIRTIKDIREWLAPKTKTPSPNLQITRPLLPNTKLCFTDAAWHKDSRKAGLGWCFLDRDSTVIKQGSFSRDFVASPLMAEALAITEALKFAHQLK